MRRAKPSGIFLQVLDSLGQQVNIIFHEAEGHIAVATQATTNDEAIVVMVHAKAFGTTADGA